MRLGNFEDSFDDIVFSLNKPCPEQDCKAAAVPPATAKWLPDPDCKCVCDEANFACPPAGEPSKKHVDPNDVCKCICDTQQLNCQDPKVANENTCECECKDPKTDAQCVAEKGDGATFNKETCKCECPQGQCQFGSFEYYAQNYPEYPWKSLCPTCNDCDCAGAAKDEKTAALARMSADGGPPAQLLGDAVSSQALFVCFWWFGSCPAGAECYPTLLDCELFLGCEFGGYYCPSSSSSCTGKTQTILVGFQAYQMCCPSDKPIISQSVSTGFFPPLTCAGQLSVQSGGSFTGSPDGLYWCFDCMSMPSSSSGSGGGPGPSPNPSSSSSASDQFYCVVDRIQSRTSSSTIYPNYYHCITTRECQRLFGYNWQAVQDLTFSPPLCYCVEVFTPVIIVMEGEDVQAQAFLPGQSPYCVGNREYDSSKHQIINGPYTAADCNGQCGQSSSSTSGTPGSSTSTPSSSSSSSISSSSSSSSSCPYPNVPNCQCGYNVTVTPQGCIELSCLPCSSSTSGTPGSSTSGGGPNPGSSTSTPGSSTSTPSSSSSKSSSSSSSCPYPTIPDCPCGLTARINSSGCIVIECAPCSSSSSSTGGPRPSSSTGGSSTSTSSSSTSTSSSSSSTGSSSSSSLPYDPNGLVLVYDTSKEPANNTISLPLSGSVNATVRWGDGTTSVYTTTGFKTHTYASPGIYIVQVSGTLTSLDHGTGSSATNNKLKLVRCLSFGNVGLTNMLRGFRGCANLVEVPSSLPSGVTNTSEMFRDCTLFNDSRVSGWNMSSVQNVSGMFVNCNAFNANLSSWNTGLATSMSNMFYNCAAFTSDLSSWTTGLVTSMSNMFFGARSYTSNMSEWNLQGLNANTRLDNFMSVGDALTTPDYDATLVGWNSDKSLYRNDLRPNFGSSKYTCGSAAAAARNALVAYGWTITDGGCVDPPSSSSSASNPSSSTSNPSSSTSNPSSSTSTPSSSTSGSSSSTSTPSSSTSTPSSSTSTPSSSTSTPSSSTSTPSSSSSQSCPPQSTPMCLCGYGVEYYQGCPKLVCLECSSSSSSISADSWGCPSYETPQCECGHDVAYQPAIPPATGQCPYLVCHPCEKGPGDSSSSSLGQPSSSTSGSSSSTSTPSSSTSTPSSSTSGSSSTTDAPSSSSSSSSYSYDPNKLVLIYDTSKESANNTVSLPLAGATNVTVEWGDGLSSTYITSGIKTHTYSQPGVYVVQVSGSLAALDYGTGDSATNNKLKLVGCMSFGDVGLVSLRRAFRGCSNMVDIPRSLPATVTNTSETFRDCSSLVGSNLSGWDTSRVTSMSGMFVNCQLMNADLSQWGVALVTSMSNMFYNCSSFASNLAFWSVDAVESMSNMFYNANSYTSNMSGWTLSGLVFNSGVDNFMSSAAGLSTSDYDATLIGWDVKKASLLNNLRPNFGGSKYTEGSPAATARAALVAYGWTITDGGTA